KSGPSGRFYSPLVRNIARKEGIAMNELEQIDGSGTDGRVTKKDILSYIPNRSTGKSAISAAKADTQEKTDPAAKPASQAPALNKQPSKGPMVIAGPDDEIMEMDRMRKLISEHMVMSKHTSPHVTSYVEVDMTNI